MKWLFIIALGVTLAFGAASCQKENITVSSGSTSSVSQGDAPVSLRSDEDPVAMRGHVRTTGGLAISGAGVTLTPSGQSIPSNSTTTDTDGYWDIDSIKQGSYQLQISASGYITKTVNLTLQANMARIDTLIHQ